MQHRRSHLRNCGNDPYRRSTSPQQRRPVNRILHDAGESDTIRGIVVFDFVECGRVYEEDDRCSTLSDWVLCWEYHWYFTTICSYHILIVRYANVIQGPKSSAPKMHHDTSPQKSPSSSAGVHASLSSCSSGGGINTRIRRKRRPGRSRIMCAWRIQSMSIDSKP